MMPPNEASRTRQGLFTDLPRETVRKGYEQQSERGFGRYTERKMDRKATPWRPVRLCWERLRDFSDSLRRLILGNSEHVGMKRAGAVRPRPSSLGSACSKPGYSTIRCIASSRAAPIT